MPYGDTRDFPLQLLRKADHVAHLISRTQVTVAQGSPHREEASEDSLVPPPEQDLYSSPTHSRHRRGLRPARPIGTRLTAHPFPRDPENPLQTAQPQSRGGGRGGGRVKEAEGKEVTDARRGRTGPWIQPFLARPGRLRF